MSARYLGGDGEVGFLACKGGRECLVTVTYGTLLQVSLPTGPPGRAGPHKSPPDRARAAQKPLRAGPGHPKARPVGLGPPKSPPGPAF